MDCFEHVYMYIELQISAVVILADEDNIRNGGYLASTRLHGPICMRKVECQR